jgi:hypothetical protein
MEKAIAFAISAGIVCFGIWILVAAVYSSTPIVWVCFALLPVGIGLMSTFGDY